MAHIGEGAARTRPLHALLKERIPRALPSADGHPPLGPGRAPRVRALHLEAHTQIFEWIARRGIFAEGGMGHGRYEDPVTSLKMPSSSSATVRRSP
jgi:hypothetical protein